MPDESAASDFRFVVDFESEGMEARIYYEAHVTIEPLNDLTRPAVQTLCDRHGFKIAEFLMQRADSAAPDVPANDPNSFVSCRETNKTTMIRRITYLVLDLRKAGIEVRRYKMEDTLVDSRHGDEWGLLSHSLEGVKLGV